MINFKVKFSCIMAEFVESESDFRKVKNALVSRSIHIGSPADLKIIAKLFVRTGSTRLATSELPFGEGNE